MMGFILSFAVIFAIVYFGISIACWGLKLGKKKAAPLREKLWGKKSQ